jgi:hypothetical protein
VPHQAPVRPYPRAPEVHAGPEAPDDASSGVEDGRFVVRARSDRGGVDQELTVTLARDGEVTGRWS